MIKFRKLDCGLARIIANFEAHQGKRYKYLDTGERVLGTISLIIGILFFTILPSLFGTCIYFAITGILGSFGIMHILIDIGVCLLLGFWLIEAQILFIFAAIAMILVLLKL